MTTPHDQQEGDVPQEDKFTVNPEVVPSFIVHNDPSSLSYRRVPNQAERDAARDEAALNLIDSASKDTPANKRTAIEDIAQNAMDNADADKGAAEHDAKVQCECFGYDRAPAEGVCQKCGGSGWVYALEDVVSGTVQQETPYQRVQTREFLQGFVERQMQTFLDTPGSVISGIPSALIDHLAGNAAQVMQAYPPQQDVVQELVGALEAAKEHDDHFHEAHDGMGCPVACTERAMLWSRSRRLMVAVLAKYTRQDNMVQ